MTTNGNSEAKALVALDTLNRLRRIAAEEPARPVRHWFGLAVDEIVAEATGGGRLLVPAGVRWGKWRDHCPDCEAVYVRLYQGELF
jgi:hypothetical protein